MKRQKLSWNNNLPWVWITKSFTNMQHPQLTFKINQWNHFLIGQRTLYQNDKDSLFDHIFSFYIICFNTQMFNQMIWPNLIREDQPCSKFPIRKSKKKRRKKQFETPSFTWKPLFWGWNNLRENAVGVTRTAAASTPNTVVEDWGDRRLKAAFLSPST